jgi:hypothetical protein
MSRKFLDLTGQKFGKLTVIKYYDKNKWGISRWVCKCDCGKEIVAASNNLKNKDVQSCGCLNFKGHIKHSMAGTRIHKIWINMKNRCNNPKNCSYKDYGGRTPPITVCDRWNNNKNGFQNFYNDVGDPPLGKSLDRINNNENYSYNNWKWSTKKEQARNRRTSYLIPYNNKIKCAAEWEEITGIKQTTIIKRIENYGWSPDRALTTPTRKGRSLLVRKYEKRLRNILKRFSNNKISFSKDLSYISSDLCSHLETIRLHQNNCCPMCYISYAVNPSEIDHIIPTSIATTKEELLKLFNLENLSLLCYKCNRYIKRDKYEK